MSFPVDAQSLLHTVEEQHEIKVQIETFHQKPSVAFVRLIASPVWVVPNV